jgi:3-oxoacyl-(acyl-carrier-protein) synthase
MKGIGVTGMGMISAIGETVDQNYSSLIHLKHGISRIENIDTLHKSAIKVGEIKRTNKELAKYLNLPIDHNFPRTSILGVIAALQAVENADITDINAVRTGLISATSVGGMDATENYFFDFKERPEFRKFILSHDPGDSSHKIADALGLKGFVTTISTACSSAANAMMLGAKMIKSGVLDRVIVGGTDALSKFTINGFKSLMILSDEENTPFDHHRKGLNLGEAAAYLVLESEDVIRKQNKKVLAYLSGYGNANDAYHQTASSENGEGATLAMQKALKVSGLQAKDIDYINVHGTATGNNDLSEGRAMINVFGDQVPDFSSTKPFTGHTLAAAGAIEAVYSILAIQNGVVFPNLNFKTPMEEFNLIPQTTIKNKEIRHVLSNSFGFGGNCSTLIFSKADE